MPLFRLQRRKRQLGPNRLAANCHQNIAGSKELVARLADHRDSANLLLQEPPGSLMATMQQERNPPAAATPNHSDATPLRPGSRSPPQKQRVGRNLSPIAV